MKRLYSVTNFSSGINEYAPNGASDIENFDIANDGSMVTRDGWGGNSGTNTQSLGGISTAETPMQVFFAGGSNRKMFVQTDANIYYRSGDNTFAAVTNSTGLPASGSAGNDLTSACDQRFSVVVADNNRTFLANTAANGRFWIDTSSATPALYKWGVDAPTPDFGQSWEIDYQYDSGTTSMLAPGIYAFAFAFELKHGGMSPLSNRIVVNVPEDKNQVKITMADIGAPTTWAASIDSQITGLSIYRTEKSTPVNFPEGEGYEETLVKSAPLKYIGSLSTSYSINYFLNGTLSYGIAALAGSLEKSAKPPNYLTNITLYGGRIWGIVGASSQSTSDQVVFSALDATAAPLYDIFPDSSSPIPHVINVRDKVTGIGASREYLSVFSQNSIQLVRGQGIISGIYNKEQAGTDLDISQYLTVMGAKDQHCVAEALGDVYFYCDVDNRVYRIDKGGNVSWISQPIQDLLDSMDQEANSSINQLFANGGIVYLARVKGDLTNVLKYDSMRNRWTHYNLGSVAKVTPMVSNDSDFTDFESGIYGLRQADKEVVRLFVPDLSFDNEVATIPTYTSQEFSFPKIARLDAVRIGVSSSTSVVLTVIADGASQTLPSTGTLTLDETNNFTARCFAKGYKFKVKFQLTGAQTVRFFELQFRSR